MHYWLNPETGTVMSLEDNEKAEDTLTPGQFWLPVHIHPNILPPADAKYAGTLPFEPPESEKPKRVPTRLGKAIVVGITAPIAIAIIASAAALAVIALRFLWGALS